MRFDLVQTEFVIDLPSNVLSCFNAQYYLEFSAFAKIGILCNNGPQLVVGHGRLFGGDVLNLAEAMINSETRRAQSQVCRVARWQQRHGFESCPDQTFFT